MLEFSAQATCVRKNINPKCRKTFPPKMKRPKSIAGLSGTLLGRLLYALFTVSKSILSETVQMSRTAQTRASGQIVARTTCVQYRHHMSNGANKKTHWLRCPVCSTQTKEKIYSDTVLLNFRLWFPICKKEYVVNVVGRKMTIAERK